MLKNWWTALLDIVYPPHCPACRSQVNEQGAWCANCLPEVIRLREAAPEGSLPAHLSGCLAVLDYNGAVKTLLHRLKFRPDRGAAEYLVWLLNHRVSWAKLQRPDAVVPVPLSAYRLATRGFNQTELLFADWTRRQEIPWLNALERLRDTRPQWQLSPLERRRNIKDAFAVSDPALVKGKTILLVDDILTTGFTLSECAKTLKKAGAKEINALALASGAVGW